MAAEKRITVKLPVSVYDRARELSTHASQHGWTALGSKRDDLPTLTAIIEEGINLLMARAAKTKGGK